MKRHGGEQIWRRDEWMILRNAMEYVHMCYCQFLGQCESWEFVVLNQLVSIFFGPQMTQWQASLTIPSSSSPDVPSVATHCQQSHCWNKLFVTDSQVSRWFTVNVGGVSWGYCTVCQWTLLPKFRRILLSPSSLSVWLEREVIKFM